MANYDLEVINGIIQVSLYFEIGFKDINIKPVDKMNPHGGPYVPKILALPEKEIFSSILNIDMLFNQRTI